MSIKISVITPTYNRAMLLSRCYDSLCRQSFADFEWILVDDGSTDGTKEVAAQLAQEEKICIRYIAKENGGKHSAHNIGVEHAAGELTICLDSDDMLTDDCLEEAWNFWQEKATGGIIGVIAKRVSLEGTPLCSAFPENVERTKMYDLNNKYHFSGDTALFFCTDVLKKCMFPIFDKEKFIPETAVYYKLDEFGEMLLLDRELYIGEYQSEGLTSKYHRLLRQNPVGTTYVYLLSYQKAAVLKEKMKYLILTAAYWTKSCKAYYRVPMGVKLCRPAGRLYRKVCLEKL